MAEPVVKQKSKDHHRRKNPGSRDFFNKQRAERNAARGKQRWVPAAIDTGSDMSPAEGFWTREPIGGEEA